MRDRGSQVWGALLIVVGVVLLLGSLGVLGGLVPFIWGLLFGAAGVVFLYVFLRRYDNWWAIFPAMTLLGVGSVIVIDAAAPPGGAAWSGGLLLAFLALAFWIVYLRLRDAWWPLIPAGVLTTLALVATVSPWIGGFASGGIFFLGMGVTFLVVSVVRTPEGRLKWALIPAGILLLVGALLLAQAVRAFAYLWAIALVVVGAYLLFRAATSRPAD